MAVTGVRDIRTGIDDDSAPSAEVTSVVRVTPAGLSLHGRDEVLLCASLFPFRIPREEWKQRLDARARLGLPGHRRLPAVELPRARAGRVGLHRPP